MSRPEDWIKLLAIGVAVFGAAAPARAGNEASAHQLVSSGEYFDIFSKAAGKEFRVFIRVPKTPPPPSGFPVVYVLDGNWYFTLAEQIATLQANTGELPPAVIVGVGYPVNNEREVSTRRLADLAPPTSPRLSERGSFSRNGGEGSTASFLTFLTEELRPFVLAHAPAGRDCETLFGHSLGGLFALQTMFTHPETFTSYVIASPSIWWDDRSVLELEAAFEARLEDGLPARALVTVGGVEQSGRSEASVPTAIAARRAASRMVDNMRELVERLSRYRSSNFVLDSMVVEDEAHNSSVPAALTRGLRFGLHCAPH